jgi:hypothetical protein
MLFASMTFRSATHLAARSGYPVPWVFAARRRQSKLRVLEEQGLGGGSSTVHLRTCSCPTQLRHVACGSGKHPGQPHEQLFICAD